MIIYIIVGLIVSAILAYQLRFTESTKYNGVRIAKDDSNTGLQNAITPPMSSNLGLLVYALTICFLGYCFYSLGWKYGIAFLFGLFVCTALVGVFLPKPESNHFYNIIIRSLMNRYANYKKTGDSVRASAIKDILNRFDIEVPEKFK